MISAGASSSSHQSWSVTLLVLVVELAVLGTAFLEGRQLWRLRGTWQQVRGVPRSSRNRVAKQIQQRQPVADADRKIADDLTRLYVDGTRWLPWMLAAWMVFALTMAWTLASFARATFLVMAALVALAVPGVLWVRRVFCRQPVTR